MAVAPASTRLSPNSLGALIFDVDGTLADTEEVHRTAFNRAFAERGLDWNWSVAQYRELLLVAGGKERIRAFWRSIDPDAADRPESAMVVGDLHALKTRHYEALLADGGVPLRPGVLRLIDAGRKAGLPIAIATTTTPANLDALLKPKLGADWRSLFAVIRDGATDPIKKPAPDVYLSVLRVLGLPAHRAIAFEDTHNGLTAATAAGIPVLVAPTDYSAGQDFSQALIVLPHLGDPDVPLPQPLPVTGRRWVDLEFLEALHHGAIIEAS